MSTDFQTFYTGRFQEQVEWCSSKATTHKRCYVTMQWAVIAFSAIVPAIAIGVECKWATATLSMLVAIGTTAIKTFKYQELWLNYRIISETLKKEGVFFTHKLGDYSSATEPEKLFIERVETLISRENSLWVICMSEEKKQTPPPASS